MCSDTFFKVSRNIKSIFFQKNLRNHSNSITAATMKKRGFSVDLSSAQIESISKAGKTLDSSPQRASIIFHGAAATIAIAIKPVRLPFHRFTVP